jgi:hypothetical protein
MVVVGADEEQIRWRNAHLVAAPLTENRRGDIEVVHVIHHDCRAARAIAEGKDAGVNIVDLAGRLGHDAARQLARYQLVGLVRRDDRLRRTRLSSRSPRRRKPSRPLSGS